MPLRYGASESEMKQNQLLTFLLLFLYFCYLTVERLHVVFFVDKNYFIFPYKQARDAKETRKVLFHFILENISACTSPVPARQKQGDYTATDEFQTGGNSDKSASLSQNFLGLSKIDNFGTTPNTAIKPRSAKQ